jgi:hypothetical protein
MQLSAPPDNSDRVASHQQHFRTPATRSASIKTVMANFLFYLASNLGLLAAVLLACKLHSRFTSRTSANGAYMFMTLASSAFAFDAALTFLVFADAQTRYGQFSAQTAFYQRAGAYMIAIIAALGWHRAVRPRHAARQPIDNSPVTHTRAIPDSHHPM